LLKASRACPAPTAESAFHITELTQDFRFSIFSPLENVFCIAKTAAYLIEK
jgi:hypothetical protein